MSEKKRSQTDPAGQRRVRSKNSPGYSPGSHGSRARVPTPTASSLPGIPENETPTSSLHGIPDNGAFLDYANYDTDDWTEDHSVGTHDGTSVLGEDPGEDVFKYFGGKRSHMNHMWNPECLEWNIWHTDFENSEAEAKITETVAAIRKDLRTLPCLATRVALRPLPCLATLLATQELWGRSSREWRNLELWTLTPCFTLEDAEKMELGKLFLESHSSN